MAHISQEGSETQLILAKWIEQIANGESYILFSILNCFEFKTESCILKNCRALEWKLSCNFKRDL